MSEAHRIRTADRVTASCPDPDCGTSWQMLPPAMPLAGYQPTLFKCRACRRWWWLLYHVRLGRGVRWSLIRIAPSYGRHPERLRESLAAMPELDAEEIELTIEMVTRQPQILE